VLKAHEPNPALAYDRHWNLVSANRMLAPLLEGVPPKLLSPRSTSCGWRFTPKAWRHVPSIWATGPRISWTAAPSV
jgi:hypothetical protein